MYVLARLHITCVYICFVYCIPRLNNIHSTNKNINFVVVRATDLALGHFHKLHDKFMGILLERSVNTLRPWQNGRHFQDDIFKCIFLNENVWISLKISLKFVPKGSINNIPALVQIMAWCRPGDKPLSEPTMVRLPTHICVIRPQWVKHVTIDLCYIGSISLAGDYYQLYSLVSCIAIFHWCIHVFTTLLNLRWCH